MGFVLEEVYICGSLVSGATNVLPSLKWKGFIPSAHLQRRPSLM
jgi:hypothetical protein